MSSQGHDVGRPAIETYSDGELLEVRERMDAQANPELAAQIDELIRARRLDRHEHALAENKAYRYATGLRRLGAALIDGVVLALLAWCIGVTAQLTADAVAVEVFAWIDAVDDLIYVVALHALFGQTLGKMICGVVVVRNDTETAIGWRIAALRDIVPLAALLAYTMFYITGWAPWPLLFGMSLVGFVWVLLDLLTMFLNPKRRAIHDFIAGTVVIREEALMVADERAQAPSGARAVSID